MDIKIPVLAENVTTGTVVKFYVSEGASVKKDQEVMELETEKAVVVIPTPVAGKVTKIHVKEGDEVKVGQVVFTIYEEKAEKVAKPVAGSQKKTEEKPQKEKLTEAQVSQPAMTYLKGFAAPASPTIRKIASELGIDLSRVQGSEKGGRIVLGDLRAYIRSFKELSLSKPEPVPPLAPLPDFKTWGPTHSEAATLIRKKIAEKMSLAWRSIPHVTQFDEADITDLTTLIKKYRPQYEKRGAHLTLTGFIIMAAVRILKRHPKFNASWDDLRGEIIFKDYYHFGIAVGTEGGLIVPVLRDVDKKSLAQLSRELNDISERTRKRKILLEELQGGTFTISNQGGIGGGHFTPIINYPEVALLGVGRAVQKLVPREGKVAERTIVPLSLSYDHRVIDGADAALCIKELVMEIEGMGEEDV